ncbi:MAG: hypothetical protein M3N09_02225 [Actinomycetota bacterium]|nr:hypothetical protein [Actinomycetota bacterium]
MARESEEKRQQFLRAAYEVAMPKGGPSSSVHVHEVAKVMGLKVRDEDVQAELTSTIEDLQEQGDAEGWSSTNGRFRLTSQGADKVKGSSGDPHY